jgi:hypothetical protein
MKSIATANFYILQYVPEQYYYFFVLASFTYSILIANKNGGPKYHQTM